VRDLRHLPANDLGPAEIADAAVKVQTGRQGTRKSSWARIAEKEYPRVRSRQSSRATAPDQLAWGKDKNSLVTLVGKGVAFLIPAPQFKTGNTCRS